MPWKKCCIGERRWLRAFVVVRRKLPRGLGSGAAESCGQQCSEPYS